MQLVGEGEEADQGEVAMHPKGLCKMEGLSDSRLAFSLCIIVMLMSDRDGIEKLLLFNSVLRPSSATMYQFCQSHWLPPT